MKADRKTATYKAGNGAVIIEIFTGPVIAGWDVPRVEGGTEVQFNQGKTDDLEPDLVSYNSTTLKDGATLAWSTLLLGPGAKVDYTVTVVVQQGTQQLSKQVVNGSLDPGKADMVFGLVDLKAG